MASRQFWKRINFSRIAVRAVALGAGISFVTCLSVGAHGSRVLHRPRQPTFTDHYHMNPELMRMPYSKLELTTEDGISLEGWWISNTNDGAPSKRIAILMHPHNNHKSNLLGVARALWDAGFSVLMFDFRAFAEEPTRASVGFHEQKDAEAAIRYVLNHHVRGKDSKIVLMGASMGGSCAILLADKFRDNISAIITDCAFPRLRPVIELRIFQTFLFFPAILISPTMYFLDLTTRMIYGYSIDDVAPIEVVSQDNFDIPILMFHSENDQIVPLNQGIEMFEACKSTEKKFCRLDSVDHCGGFYDSPRSYTSKVTKWLDRVLDLNLDDFEIAI